MNGRIFSDNLQSMEKDQTLCQSTPSTELVRKLE